VITILGDASEPGIYAQLLKVAAGAEIPAHHHAVDRIGTVLQAATLRNDRQRTRDRSAHGCRPDGHGVRKSGRRSDEETLRLCL